MIYLLDIRTRHSNQPFQATFETVIQTSPSNPAFDHTDASQRAAKRSLALTNDRFEWLAQMSGSWDWLQWLGSNDLFNIYTQIQFVSIILKKHIFDMFIYTENCIESHRNTQNNNL